MTLNNLAFKCMFEYLNVWNRNMHSKYKQRKYYFSKQIIVDLQQITKWLQKQWTITITILLWVEQRPSWTSHALNVTE